MALRKIWTVLKFQSSTGRVDRCGLDADCLTPRPGLYGPAEL